MESPKFYVVRNEPRPDHQFHCDAVSSYFPAAEEVDFPAGERFVATDADAVVLTGSSAGVYETETHPWIDEEEALVREIVSQGIPLLGVCFGHQIVNSALGGTVNHVGMTAGLVNAELKDNPLFDGVDSVVPAIHEDAVTEIGDNLNGIATANHSEIFGTHHRTKPVWTVQFHPEIDEASLEHLVENVAWDAGSYSFKRVTADLVFENFKTQVIGPYQV